MNYTEFRNKVKHYPWFRSNMLTHLTDKPTILRRQISEWLKKALLVTLKRGVYTLNDADRKVGITPFAISQLLYTPSYISLESALSYYNFIPEQVMIVTAISTKKTQTFNNAYGKFNYHHLSPENFDGYIGENDEYGNPYFIATKEKAIVDFLYLRMRSIKNLDKNIFDSSYRLQNLEILNKTKLRHYAELFKQKKLSYLVELLIEYVEAGHD